MRAIRLLILGGTTEASALARAVAGRPDLAPILSFAGRTQSPAMPPIPCRVGGFGGIAGLAAFLRDHRIDAIVDATHPFAANISRNAAAACRDAGVPLLSLVRPPWQAQPDDRWIVVSDLAAAVTWLTEWPFKESGGGMLPVPRDRSRATGSDALNVFLTTGRNDLARFRAAPRHRYVVRTIDPPSPADLPPQSSVILARPPFDMEDEARLMLAHATDLLVTKNSGGMAAAGKLAAARRLGLPVLMIDRPPSVGAACQHLDEALSWIAACRPG